ncbi:MAG: DUF1080 domain-containing protein [Armatimonadetes bacterium]|nr:DUF1080 domain-containing protein [Armatimonadota bacterium]
MAIRNSLIFGSAAALLGAGTLLATTTPAASQGQRTPQPPAFPTSIRLAGRAPMAAKVLIGPKGEGFAENWVTRGTQTAANWTLQEDGGMLPDKKDITSKSTFGDCFVHVEFKVPTGHGNAGIAFQGRYEVQMYNSFGEQLTKETGAAFYSQKPATFNAAKPAGEWQSYDILFRAPRFDAEGKVTEKARASVFWNGVLVQNNEEFNGPTGIQYGDFKGEVKVGPLVLQGNHDLVQVRNLWVVGQ